MHYYAFQIRMSRELTVLLALFETGTETHLKWRMSTVTTPMKGPSLVVQS